MEKIFDFLVKHHILLGLFFMVIGVIYILAYKKNWTWLIKPNDDDVLRNKMFGGDTTRVRYGFLGLAFFLGGLLVFIASIIYSSK